MGGSAQHQHLCSRCGVCHPGAAPLQQQQGAAKRVVATSEQAAPLSLRWLAFTEASSCSATDDMLSEAHTLLSKLHYRTPGWAGQKSRCLVAHSQGTFAAQAHLQPGHKGARGTAAVRAEEPRLLPWACPGAGRKPSLRDSSATS